MKKPNNVCTLLLTLFGRFHDGLSRVAWLEVFATTIDMEHAKSIAKSLSEGRDFLSFLPSLPSLFLSFCLPSLAFYFLSFFSSCSCFSLSILLFFLISLPSFFLSSITCLLPKAATETFMHSYSNCAVGFFHDRDTMNPGFH